MTHQLLNTPEDMRWLLDVHAPHLRERGFKSAEIEGNEDCPDVIRFYRSEHPTIDENAIVIITPDGEIDTEGSGQFR